jgi:hypothetical protein
VLCDLFDLLDTRDVEGALVLQFPGGFWRHDAGVRHRFGRGHFYLEPCLVLALLAPDTSHLGMGIARNHGASGPQSRTRDGS